MATKRKKRSDIRRSSSSKTKTTKNVQTHSEQNKSSSRRKANSNFTWLKKIPPYSLALACMGTIAVGVAAFSIFSKLYGTPDITVDHESSSDVSISSSSEASSDNSSSDNSSSESSDEIIENAVESESVPELPDIEEDIAKKVSENALCGENLNNILTDRTGVNEKGDNVGEASIPTKILKQKLSVTPMSHKSEEGDEQADSKPKDNAENKDNSSKKPEKEENKDTSSKAPEKQENKKPSNPKEIPIEKPSEEKSESSKTNSKEIPIETPDNETESLEEAEEEPETPKVKYKGSGASNIPAWKKVNNDVKGWLRIPNTNISYPVVVGPNNLYYESKDIYKNPSRNGVIWADSDTKFGTGKQISKNTVLYGHNWTNYTANPQVGRQSDVMFAQLAAFHHLDFAQKTPYVYYSTEDEEMVWQVFAAFYTESQFNYIVSDGSSTYMKNLISEAKQRSLHKYNVDVNEKDKILTLSTCTRACGPSPNQRFVVMARKLRPGEKPFTPSITANPNHKRPTIR